VIQSLILISLYHQPSELNKYKRRREIAQTMNDNPVTQDVKHYRRNSTRYLVTLTFIISPALRLYHKNKKKQMENPSAFGKRYALIT